MNKLADLALDGAVVAVRCDFNVPLNETGVITDDLRIRAAVPTILELLSRNARIVILAHMGRPKGAVVESLRLEPVATRLSELLQQPVKMLTDSDPQVLTRIISEQPPGTVSLLENVRFDPRETSKDHAERLSLAKEWATWADFFVSEGFGVVHRKQASVTELAELVPNAPGLLVEKETQVFTTLLQNPERPYTVVLGGSKVSDKLGVIESLLPRVDNLLIGGGMAYTFLLAQGMSVGTSLQEPDFLDAARGFLRQAAELGVRIVLPVDIVIAREFAADSETSIVSSDHIPDDWMGLDIGPESRELFARIIEESKTVVWNGPMGVFEMDAFAGGTLAVAQAMARSSAFTVIGGGDSAAAVRILDVDESTFDHISTGGGASLEFLEGKTLPGLAVLEGKT